MLSSFNVPKVLLLQGQAALHNQIILPAYTTFPYNQGKSCTQLTTRSCTQLLLWLLMLLCCVWTQAAAAVEE
jgi:hypothetical protein